ncbi:hypothetical protein PS706_03125 [Pseudomonas fluorescens]|nr:hypothetical protein PS706_03125 [Pseudomonas fluorescens]
MLIVEDDADSVNIWRPICSGMALRWLWPKTAYAVWTYTRVGGPD